MRYQLSVYSVEVYNMFNFHSAEASGVHPICSYKGDPKHRHHALQHSTRADCRSAWGYGKPIPTFARWEVGSQATGHDAAV